MPKVSVIVPVYNQEKYIEECVQSVLGQSYKDFELVVVDDGSTDKTPEILKKFGSKFRYIRQKNKGASAALNAGIKASKGDFLAWLSSDDVYLPTKLDEQMKFFEEHPEASLVYTDFCVIDEKGKILREVRLPFYPNKKDFILNMIRGNFINGSSVVFKKECIDRIGFFDESMVLHADENMWFRMLKHFSFGSVPKVLLKYREHAKMASKDLVAMKKFRYFNYEKLFKRYSLDDIFDNSQNLPRRRFLSKSNLELGLIFLKKDLPSLAFPRFLKSIQLDPFEIRNYILPPVYLIKSLKQKFLTVI